MNFLQVKKMIRFIFVLFVLKISCSFVEADILQYSVDNNPLDLNNDLLDFKTYEHERQRRQVSTTNTPSSTSNSIAASTNGTVPNVPPMLPVNLTDTNKTFDKDKPATVPILHPSEAKGSANSNNTSPKVSDPILANDAAAADEHRLLGVNGSGIWYMKGKNGTADNTESALSNNDLNNIFKETPETIKAEQNIANLTYDDHSFYKSSFIGNVSYFQEYWTNISKSKSEPHEILSNSHRRASEFDGQTFKLSFDFPFYGHSVRNITVATGGFLYTGDLVHNWLAATQYISPLMANFDTTISNDSLVKMSDDGEKFTVFWENATLQEAPTKKFTFAVTLYKNGDIVFAYKDIPISVQSIQDDEHPVKVGISDAYLKDKILFYVRRKTIYEYHRVSFKNHEISNNTILRLTALPTCLQYNTCSSCVNHDTGFNCTWCEQIQKCSSGTDRNKQDWLLRNCDKFPISNETACPAVPHVDAPSDVNTAYATDNQSHRATVVHTLDIDEVKKSEAPLAASVASHEQYSSSPVGGVVTAFIVISLICCLGGWLFYAFKNPLSRSGQILIRYRPSQWGWRRGEARYTAATIHM